MLKQGGCYAMWKPEKGISGAAYGGRMWVESINTTKGTALVRYANERGLNARLMCARLDDLTPIGPEPYKKEEPFCNGPDTNF